MTNPRAMVWVSLFVFGLFLAVPGCPFVSPNPDGSDSPTPDEPTSDDRVLTRTDCRVDTDCDDRNACTIDRCVAGLCVQTNSTADGECCNPETGLRVIIDDGNACTQDSCDPGGSVVHLNVAPADHCCNPSTGVIMAIDDFNVCTTDICEADGSVSHVDRTPSGQCCNPITGNFAFLDDGNACTADICNLDGTVSHTDTTPPGFCCNPINQTLSLIDDNNACTEDECGPDGTVARRDLTPANHCCNELNGVLTTPLDDGNACTQDICSPNGGISHIDVTPPGQCCNPFAGTLTPVDDGNVCTQDVCNRDGTVTHALLSGNCDDGDGCTSNDVCLNGICAGSVVDPLCTPTLTLTPVVEEAREGSCPQTGEFVNVRLEMGPSTTEIVGGDFFLRFDPSQLRLTGIENGDPPFSIHNFQLTAASNGSIDFEIDVLPDEAGSHNGATLAVLTFEALESCLSEVEFRTQPPTKLFDATGFTRAPILGPPATFVVTSAESLTLMCPPDIRLNSDAGTFSATATWPSVTAADECDGMLLATCNRVSGGTFSVGTTTINCQAVNSCGLQGSCSFGVTVDPISELLVSVQLSPAIVPGPLTRCITFELIQCGFVAETVEAELTFINGLAIDETVLVPAGIYDCLKAKDSLHTLKSTADDFRDSGRVFTATFIGDRQFGGHALIGGDINDDGFIDVVDYAIFQNTTNRLGLSPDTTCDQVGPHPDINGDGMVNALDFSFIFQHLLKANEADCCTQVAAASSRRSPRADISVRELRSLGLGHLSSADMNYDGMIDGDDMNAFKNGITRKERPADRREKSIWGQQRD